jgi:GrpB-like predicted nucleotidyltransferase (UPF0157 family)
VRADPIVIVAHDPEWANVFARERARLQAAFGTAVVRPIEHIGSTSVPGLPAKAIVDMLAVVDRIDDADAGQPAVEATGWIAAPEPEDADERRRSFCFPSIELRTCHLHVVEEREPAWRGWLAFRDHLRVHADVAAQYASLKRTLAIEHGTDPDDRAAYRAGKAAFIRAVTATALACSGNGRDG